MSVLNIHPLTSHCKYNTNSVNTYFIVLRLLRHAIGQFSLNENPYFKSILDYDLTIFCRLFYQMLTKPYEKFKLKIVYPKYSGYWQKSKNIRSFSDINKLTDHCKHVKDKKIDKQNHSMWRIK